MNKFAIKFRRLQNWLCIKYVSFFTLVLLSSLNLRDLAAQSESDKSAAKQEPVFIGTYKAKSSHATIEGYLEPKVVAPGETAKLVLTATISPDYKIYEFRPTDNTMPGSKPTLIVLNKLDGWKFSVPMPSEPPQPDEMPYYQDKVSWAVEIVVPKDIDSGEREISGSIGYQTCSLNKGCDPLQGASFRVPLHVGATTESGQIPLEFTKSKHAIVAAVASGKSLSGISSINDSNSAFSNDSNSKPETPLAAGSFDPKKIVLDDDDTKRPLYSAIWLALVGGFILNFMPCVLPVIGLKVMSFVQQSGENRARAFLLNVWYSAGLLAVFMTLATLAVVYNYGWGMQNQNAAFNIVMASIVFAMGLSMLGVWEIPIPGFVGSGKTAELAEQEGPLGAFLKGVITTILAVPCSGPGIATALAFCAGKPAIVVYGIFACMALGMASPYLVIGANPGLIRFIPKPGKWMETFKEVMGFVLLGTVVFIMSYIHSSDVLPTVAFLFGIWAGCWYIGHTPITVSSFARARAWGITVLIIAITGMFAFTKLHEIMHERFIVAADSERSKPTHKLKAEPFSVAKVRELTAAGKTVLVDFTANWCLTCKTLESAVLKTDSIQNILKEREVVTLIADWTNEDEEITSMLGHLGSEQIPVIALFPARDPNRPLVLRGWYTKSQLTKNIELATDPSERQAKLTIPSGSASGESAR